jgi:hypothetical protein
MPITHQKRGDGTKRIPSAALLWLLVFCPGCAATGSAADMIREE